MPRAAEDRSTRTPANRTRIVPGDCLDVLEAIDPVSADLAYLDPPFNTGRTQRTPPGFAGADAPSAASYEDCWTDMPAYLSFLRPRVEAVRRVLKPSASILLHCDWRTSHHLRLMLDEVFGAERFVNHLIWQYGLGGSSPRRFARKHDDILFYARSDEYYFHPPRVPATSQRMKGQMKKATDVLDIPAINNMAAERVGYPSQKPLALLEMLIEACCPPGGFVIDPFCGSGTTVLAARRLGCGALGIDTSEAAVAIARQRLEAAPAQPAAPIALPKQ